jgi:signal transduction histidine kinase
VEQEESSRHTYDVIKRLPYGTHLCQFYRNKADLLEVLIPYFKVGLRKNDLCLCLCSEPLGPAEARAALGKAVKNLPSYLERGQIEFIDVRDWYGSSMKLSSEQLFRQSRKKYALINQKGFNGLRFMRNASWLNEPRWDEFIRYETEVSGRIGIRRAVALCCYPSRRYETAEFIDVVNSHPLALVKDGRGWELCQNSTIKRKDNIIRADEEALESFKKELRLISRRLLSVREEEKRNLAVSLHNSAGSLAIALGSHLVAVKDHLANKRPDAAMKILDDIQAAVTEEIRIMKRMAVDLRPPDLDEFSLAEVLKAYFFDISKQHQIPIDFRNELPPSDRSNKKTSQALATAFFRIAQEAVVNVIKHSGATKITARITQSSDKIKLGIADDGRGFNTRNSLKNARTHLGLVAMHELAASAGGTLRITSSPGKGTLVSATVPTRSEASL